MLIIFIKMDADFDIGNLVYIILMIVFIIVGAFGKKKKSKVRPFLEDNAVKTDSPQDLLELKLKEFFAENTESVPGNQPVQVSEVLDSIDDKLDIVVQEEATASIEYPVFPEQNSDQQTVSVEYQGEILDFIGKEEGIASWHYIEETHITDEISLSEGKEIVSVDYNEELLDFQQEFDARKGFLYSEVMNRKEYLNQ